MRQLSWAGNNDFTIEGVRFTCVQRDYSARTDKERFVILKDRDIITQYAAELGGESIKNVFEFGIFQGGSAVLFTLWFELEKFVGVDVLEPVSELQEFLAAHECGKRIRTYHGVSQADRERLEQIVQAEFGATPIDLIIDDASHRYSTTRKAFECAFPLLRPGGSYVIEDWGWAHWADFDEFRGQTALSKLVMELIMLCASRSDIVSEVRVFPWFVLVKKSAIAPQLSTLDLDELIRKRGIELVGTKDLNITGVLSEVCSRVFGAIR